MARKIIQGPLGQLYSVTHADFLAVYQGIGYTEIADEPDPVVYTQLPTYADVDDMGAWDSGPFYYITSPDGRVYGATLDNYINRYQVLGYTIGAGLGGEPTPTFASIFLLENGDFLTTESGDYLVLEAA